jgi:hypothetical protein
MRAVHFHDNGGEERPSSGRVEQKRSPHNQPKESDYKMTDVSTTQPSAPVQPVAPPAAPAAPAVLHYRDAYDNAQPAAKALNVEDLISVNIDLPTAVTTAVGALPEILALRDQVVKDLPNFDIKNFDLLETYTRATGHAHALYMGASAAPEAILALNEQGITLRDLLYSDATALATRGIISGDKLGDFKANVGYKNLAFDLLGLASVLRLNWDKIASKTAIQPSELDTAESIGEQLVSALGAREQAPAAAAEQAQQRQRNFTLFAKAYDQVRRAVSFLHWDQDDVERIAPSLYAGRNTGRKKSDPAQPGTAPTTGTSLPSPGAAAGTTTPTPPAAGTTAPSAHPQAAHVTTPTTAGLPGASPFASLS